MKRLAVFAFAAVAVACAHAQVTPIGFFNTPPALQEGFDTTAAGVYAGFPVFSVPAVALQIGSGGGLVVRPFPGVNTAPHMMFGDAVDVRILSVIPMRRFGGFFRSGVNGVFSPFATFRFYDASNNIIGTQIVPMTTTFQWVGFSTTPKWRRVDILGAIPGLPGHVAMDSLRMRPN